MFTVVLSRVYYCKHLKFMYSWYEKVDAKGSEADFRVN